MEEVVVELQNASELCTRCGLCCVGLRAWCTVEDAEKTCAEMSIPLDQFVNVEERDEKNKVLMKFPCTFLRGSILHYVSCAAYKVPRPEVCHVYYCRVATQYRLRHIMLDEALALLRRGFWLDDVAAYNWCRSEEDAVLTQIHNAAVAGCDLEQSGFSRDVINYTMMTHVLPRYAPANEIDQNLLSMHFYLYDVRHTVDVRKRLTFYLGDAALSMDDHDVEVAMQAIDGVFDVLREMVHFEGEEIK